MKDVVTTKNFKPMRDDVLLYRRPEKDKGLIFVKDTADSDTHHHYLVMTTGAECRYVKAGDVVVVDWRKITQPFEIRDESGNIIKVAITSEREISAIID